MPADHLIRNEEAFREAVGHAARLAVAGHLVTFGVVPDAAETGFGYIELGDRLDEQGRPRCAASSRNPMRKPPVATWKVAVSWNSGMFCFTASTLVDELAQHAPALLEQARAWPPVRR